MPDEDDVVRAELPYHPASAGLARRVVRKAMAGWGCAQSFIDAAVQVTSEVVTNSLLHAGSGARLTLVRDESAVRVEVVDSSPRRPIVRQYGAEALTGRGMEVVEALAMSWGVEDRPPGKAVWVLLAPGDERSREEPASTAPSHSGQSHSAAASPDPATPSGDLELVYLAVPVVAYLDLQERNDIVLREFELLALKLAAEDEGSTSLGLRGILAVARDDFARAGAGLRSGADEALARGEDRVDIVTRVGIEWADGFKTYTAALEAADMYASGHGLIPPIEPEVARLRHWLADEAEAQIGAGRAPEPFRA